MITGGASRESLAPLDAYQLGPKGVPLAEIARLADRLGVTYRLVRRGPDEPVPVPSIMHWKFSHFSAVVGVRDDRYELLDATFGQPRMWLSRTALDAETSGYFLVPGDGSAGPWRSVPREEAEQVRGRNEPAP
jgi:ABC-type bacteriocin/lantibiotic exporter with double-glycine peptidase domain